MCDTIAGELIVCFRDNDPAGAGLIEQIIAKNIDHVEIIDSLHERIGHRQLTARKTHYRFYRLRVPEGQENFKINYLQFFYKHELIRAASAGHQFSPEVLAHSNCHLQIVPTRSWLFVKRAAFRPSAFQLPRHMMTTNKFAASRLLTLRAIPLQPSGFRYSTRAWILRAQSQSRGALTQ